MKYIQNNQKSSENPYQPKDFLNLKKKIYEPKSRDSCQFYVISKKKTIP